MRVFGLGPTELIIILAIVRLPLRPEAAAQARQDVWQGHEGHTRGHGGQGRRGVSEGDPEAKTEAAAEETKKPEETAV